ncbi:hypothetical protein CXG81DRAFT_18375 [Caulochytrium protostelioides]|uniref:RNB-domain-containing protein n=1 Tax=Caulochytrium protostelioides TaxID=1555241 RepID=A0A4P9WX85_9FUNG|nr:RNB-domain-containing protein [Caulochytrium protostelioides]RKP01874.1 hypothetical protein CXG81DRAFT_18375 [Caulochytrium protostelioides]|eukprot:RKP01874.1 hypothetical protein CXG81DRAFT_18375 [Caulochytrium protostelioides]
MGPIWARYHVRRGRLPSPPWGGLSTLATPSLPQIPPHQAPRSRSLPSSLSLSTWALSPRQVPRTRRLAPPLLVRSSHLMISRSKATSQPTSPSTTPEAGFPSLPRNPKVRSHRMPGDLALFRVGSALETGIILETRGGRIRGQCTVITKDGHTIQTSPAQLLLVIQGWARRLPPRAPSAASSAGLRDAVVAERLTGAGLPASSLAYLRAFETNAMTMLSRVAPTVLQQLPVFLATQPADPPVSLESLVQYVFHGRPALPPTTGLSPAPDGARAVDTTAVPTPAQYYAVLSHLCLRTPCVRAVHAAPAYYETQIALHTSEDTALLNWVETFRGAAVRGRDGSWVAAKPDQPQLAAFLNKVRVQLQWLERAQADHPPPSGLGDLESAHAFDLVYRQRPAVQWSADDQRFIAVFHKAAMTVSHASAAPFKSVAGRILTVALGPRYSSRSSPADIHQLLKDIGVLPDWDTSHVAKLAPRLLTEPDVETLPHVPAAQIAAWNAAADARDPVTDTVFVIDSTTAHELDDGISVAPIPGDRQRVRLSVHVADPASLIPDDHPSLAFAMQRALSVYTPDTFRPMLPTAIGTLTSLASGRHVITFSATVDLATGAMDAVDVRPMTIRAPVAVIDYGTVDTLLTHDGVYGWLDDTDVEPHVRETVRLAKRRLAQRQIEMGEATPMAAHAPALQLLQQAADAHRLRRVRQNAVMQAQTEFTVGVTPSPPAPFPPSSPACLPTVAFDPLGSNFVSPARTTVSECMVMAGVMAAAYCASHDLPALYRHQGALPAEGQQLLASLRDPQGGWMTAAAMEQLLPHMPPGGLAVTPHAHASMGLPADPADPNAQGYVQCTSPLRRVRDLVVHRQLHAHFAGRAAMPYGAAELRARCDGWLATERQLNQYMAQMDRYWALVWLSRHARAVAQGVVADADGAWEGAYPAPIAWPARPQSTYTARDPPVRARIFVVRRTPNGCLGRCLEMGGFRVSLSGDSPLGAVVLARLASIDLTTLQAHFVPDV